MIWNPDELADELSVVAGGRSPYTARELRDLRAPASAETWSVDEVERWLSLNLPREREGWWETEASRRVAGLLLRRRLAKDRSTWDGLLLDTGLCLRRLDDQREYACVDLTLLVRCAQPYLELLCSDHPVLDSILDGLSEWLDEGAGQALPCLLASIGTPVWVEYWMSGLTDRQRYVLEARRPVAGKGLTLSAVGEVLRLSRERVRQIEGKAIEALTHKRFQVAIEAWESVLAPKIWAEIAGNSRVVSRDDVDKWIGESPYGPDRMILDVGCGGVKEVLERAGVRVGNVWYRSSEAHEEVCAHLDPIRRQLKASELPVPVDSLAARTAVEPEVVEAALKATKEYSSFSGFAVASNARLAGRRLRLVRAHRLLSEARCSVSLSVLCRRYRERHSDDLCSPRDLLIVMRPAPHLFLQMMNARWVALSQSLVERPVLCEPIMRCEAAPWVGEDDQGTLQCTIRHALCEVGGASTMRALRAALVENPDVDMSAGSLMAVLSEREEFVRLAPGVYATATHASSLDPIRAESSLLLKKKDLLAYLVSRAAGEPRNLYPLWTPAMERCWCHWAQHHVSSDIFKSLLFVSEPEAWPVGESERRQWAQRKRREGDYGLRQDLRRPMEECRVEIERFLALWLEVARIGRMSWVRANRVALARVDNHHAAGALAILVALGVLHPADHWQSPHQAKDLDLPCLGGLIDELHRHGELSWKTGPGLELLGTAIARATSPYMGWVSARRLTVLCEHIAGSGVPLAHDSADFSASYLVQREAELLDLAELFEE